MSTVNSGLGVASGLALLLVGLLANDCAATQIFYDDFSDGSVTNDMPLDVNGDPVVWTPIPGSDIGTFDATSGDFVLTGSDMVTGVLNHVLDDVSVRTLARFEGTRGVLAFYVRGAATGDSLSTYVAGISSENEPQGRAAIGKLDPWPNWIPLALGGPIPGGIVGREFFLQVDALQNDLGVNEIDLYVWRPGEQMPDEPTLSVQDDSFSSGATAIVFDTTPFGPGTATFRFVQVADTHIVPEPSAVTLGLLSIMFLGGWRRRMS